MFFLLLVVVGNETTRNGAPGGMLALSSTRVMGAPARGPHFCLGRHLASLELRVLLAALAERMPDLRPDGEVSRLRSNLVNGIKHMPVRFTPSAPRC